MGTTNKKNIILFVGSVPKNAIESIRLYEKEENKTFRIALIYDKDSSINDLNSFKNDIDILIECDFSNKRKISESLAPYKKELFSVTCRSDINIPYFQKIIPSIDSLDLPNKNSLAWAINKILMRQKVSSYDKKISPLFMVVSDSSLGTIKKIEKKIGYPVVVKPASLASSLLVSVCFHKDELKKALNNIFDKIKEVYESSGYKSKQGVLVEQYMGGEIYSVDAYISPKEKIYLCPFVHAKNGRSVGFEDFFEYELMTPTHLNKNSKNDAEDVARKAIKALSLTACSAHIELMKTEDGWKVIEIGPRLGGWRNFMYGLSYGINHTMNDILVRLSKKPKIPRKILGYTAVMQFYPQKEGEIVKIGGIKKINKLKSFKDLQINKKRGDVVKFAKNGGKGVLHVFLFNKIKSDLLGDIRRLEELVDIETK